MHPLDPYFIELRDRRRKEMRKRKKTLTAVAAVSAMAKLAADAENGEYKETSDSKNEAQDTIGDFSRPKRGLNPSICSFPTLHCVVVALRVTDKCYNRQNVNCDHKESICSTNATNCARR